MGSDSTVLGVVIAVVGLVGSVLVARISQPRSAPAPERVQLDAGDADELRVSPEIWQRFERLERKVDHLTALVETKKAEVSALEKLLRSAMRIVRRQQRRLRAHGERPEDVPLELVPYSID